MRSDLPPQSTQDGAVSHHPLLRVDRISKNYGSAQILDGLDFVQRRGEFLSIVGPSGCGKSTLLRCIASLMQPNAGSVRHKGDAFTDPPGWLSIVFQDYGRALFPWLSVRQNVAFGLRNVSAGEKKERVEAAVEAVNLTHAIDLYPWQLSGGMQQRCSLARSIVVRPELLLLDEPFASVDAQTRIDLQDLVIDLSRRMNLTTLLVTHDVEEAIYMSDRILVLSTRPARVIEEIEVGLPYPRDQLATKETSDFLRIRHRVHTLIRAQAKTTSNNETGE